MLMDTDYDRMDITVPPYITSDSTEAAALCEEDSLDETSATSFLNSIYNIICGPVRRVISDFACFVCFFLIRYSFSAGSKMHVKKE